ncbi:hypothetical protein EDB89DRAFT_1901980 [Lactarius sanguifluus]|nr:hypothetical protein EDB89DRAFT_1901980 [Lactarius sanguifluus]
MSTQIHCPFCELQKPAALALPPAIVASPPSSVMWSWSCCCWGACHRVWDLCWYGASGWRLVQLGAGTLAKSCRCWVVVCTPRMLSHGCHGSLQLKLEVHLIIVHVSIVISTVTPQHLNQRRQHHPAAVTTILCKVLLRHRQQQDDIIDVNNDNNNNNNNNEANNNNDTDNNNKTMSTGTQTARHNNMTRQYHDPDMTAGSATLMGILMRSSSSLVVIKAVVYLKNPPNPSYGCGFSMGTEIVPTPIPGIRVPTYPHRIFVRVQGSGLGSATSEPELDLNQTGPLRGLRFSMRAQTRPHWTRATLVGEVQFGSVWASLGQTGKPNHLIFTKPNQTVPNQFKPI